MKRKNQRQPADACKPAEYNPRTIKPEALAGLRASIRIFGDLSGFVWNETTGNIVCGHQRRAALKGVDLAAVAFGEEYTVDLGREADRFRSFERDGFVTTPGGARFRVRRVKWPAAFEKAANVAANNPLLQGEFTDQLADVIAELQAGMPAELQFDELVESLGLNREPAVKSRELPPPPPMTWVLIGVPTVRFGEISAAVEGIAAQEGILSEVTATNAESNEED